VTKVYFHGTREQAREIVRNLAAILTGRTRDSLNIAQGVFLALGFAALSDIKADFIRKSHGGVGEDGEQWPKLSPEYLAYQRRFGPGEKRALNKAAGVTAGMKFAPGSILKTTVIEHTITEKIVQNKGLLTKAQVKRWNLIFSRTLARLLLSMPPGEAKARAAQIAWATLKREGAKTMLDVYGHGEVDILRDTGVLLNSLSPGRITGSTYSKPTADGGEEQIFTTIANGVIVGTNVPYASVHNHGSAKLGIPKRQFLPKEAPRVWVERWLRVANQAFSTALRMAFQVGA
jgi:hypothetical protein